MNETCWAGPLSRAERDELARLLARWADRASRARRKYYGRENVVKRSYLTSLAAEMTDLWLDVSGQREPSGLLDQADATCANCRRPIRRNAGGGDWYHRGNASTSCYPCRGSRKRATPREVED